MAAEMLVAHPGSVNTMPVYQHAQAGIHAGGGDARRAELSKSVVAHDKRLTAP